MPNVVRNVDVARQTGHSVAMPNDSDVIPTGLMTRAQAAKYLGVTEVTMAQMAHRGTGPQYAKLSGRLVRYRLEDLDAWVESALRTKASA